MIPIRILVFRVRLWLALPNNTIFRLPLPCTHSKDRALVSQPNIKEDPTSCGGPFSSCSKIMTYFSFNWCLKISSIIFLLYRTIRDRASAKWLTLQLVEQRYRTLILESSIDILFSEYLCWGNWDFTAFWCLISHFYSAYNTEDIKELKRMAEEFRMNTGKEYGEFKWSASASKAILDFLYCVTYAKREIPF